MSHYEVLLSATLALLVGIAAGKLWERYRIQEGQWIDRRRARESPHFILGLNALVSNQIDLAIEELTRAARVHDALEIQMILGNLYREKGQVGRAITLHQKLLQRPKLRKLEQAYVVLCLGLDYKRGGFVDRAFEAFDEVLRLDPENRYALVNLEKISEEQHRWQDAYQVRQRLIKMSDEADQPRNRQILAFLETELGKQDLKRMDYPAATARFMAAIDLDVRTVPAHLSLGDVKSFEGHAGAAAESWARVLEVSPERAYLAFDRLESAYSQNEGRRFEEICRRLIAAAPNDWRARLALARHLAARGSEGEAIELLLEALPHNPHGLAIHQAIWHTLVALGLDRKLVQRYIDLTRQSVFYLDPHVCQRCRYRSTELLWQCPHCHEWDTFVEERIAPAKEVETGSEAGQPSG